MCVAQFKTHNPQKQTKDTKDKKHHKTQICTHTHTHTHTHFANKKKHKGMFADSWIYFSWKCNYKAFKNNLHFIFRVSFRVFEIIARFLILSLVWVTAGGYIFAIYLFVIVVVITIRVRKVDTSLISFVSFCIFFFSFLLCFFLGKRFFFLLRNCSLFAFYTVLQKKKLG